MTGGDLTDQALAGMTEGKQVAGVPVVTSVRAGQKEIALKSKEKISNSRESM